MKIMILNSKIKHKSKTVLEVIRNLVLDFILFVVTVYMRKCPMHITAQDTTQNTLTSIEEVVELLYDKQLTAVTTHKSCSKLLQ